jgi:UMF1 family MFS transporter
MVGVGIVAAFLPELARPEAIGKVSGWGWGFGYVGGLITLALCLAYVQWAQAHGSTATQFVPVTMLITAGVFALAATPALLIVQERAQPGRHGRSLRPARGCWRRCGTSIGFVTSRACCCAASSTRPA